MGLRRWLGEQKAGSHLSWSEVLGTAVGVPFLLSVLAVPLAVVVIGLAALAEWAVGGGVRGFDTLLVVAGAGGSIAILVAVVVQAAKLGVENYRRLLKQVISGGQLHGITTLSSYLRDGIDWSQLPQPLREQYLRKYGYLRDGESLDDRSVQVRVRRRVKRRIETEALVGTKRHTALCERIRTEMDGAVHRAEQLWRDAVREGAEEQGYEVRDWL